MKFPVLALFFWKQILDFILDADFCSKLFRILNLNLNILCGSRKIFDLKDFYFEYNKYIWQKG